MAQAARRMDIDPVFSAQVTQHQQQAQHDANNLQQLSAVCWLMPELRGWNGDPFDYEGMKQPFSRDNINDDFAKACQQESPGVSGDAIIATTQVDYLSTMERSFRARHTSSFPRTLAHAIGRRRGHGDQASGLFQVGVLDYLRGIVKEASSATP